MCKQTEVIPTARCYLSDLNPEDAEEAAKLYTNPETRKFLGGALSAQEAAIKLRRSMESGETVFTVRLKESRTLIGLMYIAPYHDPRFHEVSYEFLPEFWGNGYAFEVMKACLEYCKNVLKLTELFAETQTRNVRSRNLLEKSGYQAKRELTRFGERQTVYHIHL